MDIIPAIDLRGGKAVRLFRGDYSRETVFDEDPVQVAVRWESEGARRLHVVDLDGARTGVPTQTEIVQRILASTSIPVQVGGAVRSMDDIQRLLALGIDRVVLGTLAVEDPDLVVEACRRFGPDRVVVGIDARDGRVAVRGWQQSSAKSSIEVGTGLATRGVIRFVYTDIARDGTLEGPNVAAVAAFRRAVGTAVIASGGVANAADVLALKAAGAEAVIIGRALYSGALALGEAIEAGGAESNGGG